MSLKLVYWETPWCVTKFCDSSSNGPRKSFCYPGARLNDISVVYEVTSSSERNTLYVAYYTLAQMAFVRRDLRNCSGLGKYRRMIKQFKIKTNDSNIVIPGILPRVRVVSIFYNSAFSPNKRLKTVARETFTLSIYGTKSTLSLIFMDLMVYI